MHSNLTPFIAAQRVAELHEQAARYRTQHPSLSDQPAEAPKLRRRPISLLHLATHSVYHRRTA